ncbi:carbon monoxide dehydrogenase [Burkholderia multivorans]|uniref:Carbon monoxide dehydrogenase subunit G n=1 Tax=Burkholderia multivorans CGD2 TaxID=513052 RepID=B9BTH9_9BURK|nr:SRPBCC domain-containing protein [Burkholderia multivorans]EEE05747.1 carbon monoxide dehydrogenase subunit G [Burkholderia multivorans CGD2]EEE12833.1 carbon monoxide dehydrogenase subunit G [Burkholderia multivorans CGD2M]MBH9661358.1 carbon monoxide dehydrogenase [Burkholderia multivorans]MBU9369369.1 carbon monoxide dehydrogenase [Burkholderia multivorans]MCA8373263.1 carbon monoxide dehydrogenase [Burkholderia multivorans]
MELNDTLCVALAPAVVRDALEDVALLRASVDHCESFVKRARDEFALTITVPHGTLRARYEVRVHVAAEHGDAEGRPRRMLGFHARAEGLGALRGQIDVVLAPDDAGGATCIEYRVWATATGPLAELPARQIENALRDCIDDFFREFCAIVQAKHGLAPNRARAAAPRRPHVFLRPAALTAAAKRPASPHLAGASGGRAAGALHHRQAGPVPLWAWVAMIVFVALLLYVARWFNGG